jgi:small subunit ribosomal protein S20
MPIIKSAKKRVRVARKATIRNSKTKRALRTAVKAFQAAVSGSGDKKAAAGASASLSEAHSNIDKAVKKGLMHKNKAARQKAQLAAKAKAAGATPAKVEKKAASKPAAAKPAAKKAAPKAAAKPAAAKKAPAKKPATKK